MQSIQTLIRVNKFQLDDKRRRLKEMRTVSEDLQISLSAMEEELAREQAIAQNSVEAQRAYEDYAKAMKDRKLNLLESIESLEEEIAGITADIADTFSDLKRFELTDEEKKSQSRKHQKRRETIAMDEVSSGRYQRVRFAKD